MRNGLVFRTRDGDAITVASQERSRLVRLVAELGWRAIERNMDPAELSGPSPLRRAVALAPWVTGTGSRFAATARQHLTMPADTRTLVHAPHKPGIDHVLDVHLNTVLVEYPDTVAVAARMACQADNNPWIDGPCRSWLADLIDNARHTRIPADAAPTGKILTDRAWHAVTTMLRADDKGTVVLARDGAPFPDRMWVGRPGQDLAQVRTWWHHADPDERWDTAEGGLREHSVGDPTLCISPGNLRTAMFGAGITWKSLAATWRTTTA